MDCAEDRLTSNIPPIPLKNPSPITQTSLIPSPVVSLQYFKAVEYRCILNSTWIIPIGKSRVSLQIYHRRKTYLVRSRRYQVRDPPIRIHSWNGLYEVYLKTRGALTLCRPAIATGEDTLERGTQFNFGGKREKIVM